MKKSNIIMLIAALLPLGLFLFPLWNITLEAPQYPIPLGMNIHINDFADAHPHVTIELMDTHSHDLYASEDFMIHTYEYVILFVQQIQNIIFS